MNHVAPIAKKIVLPPSTSRPTVYSTKTVRKKLNDIPFRLSTLSLLVSLLFTSPVTAYADVTVTSSAEGGTAVHAPSYIDTVDNRQIGAFYYLNNESSEDRTLTLNFSGAGLVDNPKWDGFDNKNRIYAAGTFRSLSYFPGTSVNDPERERAKQAMANNISIQENGVGFVEGIKTLNKQPFYVTWNNTDTPDKTFSAETSDYTLIANLEEGASATAKLHGGRNDLFGDGDGSSSHNTLIVNLGKNALLASQIIFGGRSAQKETYASYKGFATDYNRVYINGSTLLEKNAFADTDPGQAELVSRAGIWGAEGYQTNHNYVSVRDATITGQSDSTAKFGIIGGRGFYSYRLNTGHVDNPNHIPESSISNHNIVVIKNSHIGLESTYSATSSKSSTSNDTQYTGKRFSIYGGYSAGIAENNIVAIENSIINGNVFGGFELQDQLQGNPAKLRELNPNLVSLHNVTLSPGNAVYGSATADTVEKNVTGNSNFKPETEGQIFFDEEKLYAVNRRRGIAYIAGQNTIGSAYVRYIHFGQYYAPDKLEPGTLINVSQSYYPSEVPADKRQDSYTASPLDGVTYTNDPDYTHYDDEQIRLGQQVAGSFLINTSGFHSSLSKKTPQQSTSTNGKHNFWVSAYTNLASHVDGNGTSLDTATRLFRNDKKTVNHYYGENGDEQLSLLTHDDGMVFNTQKIDGATNSHTDALMHQFRYHYDGRILYLGINNGQDADGKNTHAVIIDFDDIEKYRQENRQQTNAFGNTQIGISVYGDPTIYGKKSVKNGNQSTSLQDMTFDIGGFEINQGNQQVATATYGFYKYMHFDGTDQTITSTYLDENDKPQTESISGKVTGEGQEGGVGIKYWLKSVDVLPDKQLALYGAKEDDLKPDSGIEESAYTLSARVTGAGGVYIPEKNTVIMGDEKSIYRNPIYNPDWENWRNTYTGETTVDGNAVVRQGSDHALGNTKNLDMAAGSAYQLNGKTQTIGGLQQADGSTIQFDARAGTPDESGHLTIDGSQSQNPDGVALAVVSGNLEGNQNAVLDTRHTDLTINSGNANYAGAVNLKESIARLENARALKSASTAVGTGSRLYLNGAEAGNPNPYGNTNTHHLNNLTNAGTVYLSRQNDASVDTVNTVRIAGDYQGNNGTLVYHTQLNGDHDSPTDFIHINGTADGTGKVAVNALPGSNGARTDNGIHILHAENAEPDFTLTEGGPIVGGAYYYGLEGRDEDAKGGKENWYLVNTGEVRAEAGSYVDNSLAWAEMHMRLHDRMGQAYYRDPFTAEVKETAAWGRIVGNHTHFQMGNGVGKTHSETEIIQLGSDLLRQSVENSDWKYNLGVFGGYLNNRSETRSRYTAKSKVDGYTLGVYGTLYTGNSPDDGFYLDSWLMWGNYDNEVYGSLPKFSYDADGWVASLEAGKTLPIGETGEKGINHTVWTLQPQAQVIWDGMKADRAEDSSHTVYRQLGADNVILRLGSRLHANFENKGLGFLELNWIHNTKKRGVWMNGDSVYQDGSRDSGEVRIGAEGYLEKNTLGWVTLGVRAGNHGYHEESAQLGIKYLF